MTNVSAVEKMAELMQQMEENSPRVASLRYCLQQVAEKVEEAEKRYAELEARCAALAAEVYDLKHPGTYLPSKRETPATDAFLVEVRASGVEEFLRGSQLPYQIATVLAGYDNVDDATLQTVIWSGQPPEPDGDVWHLEYVSRGNAIVRAVLKELRKGVQS